MRTRRGSRHDGPADHGQRDRVRGARAGPAGRERHGALHARGHRLRLVGRTTPLGDSARRCGNARGRAGRRRENGVGLRLRDPARGRPGLHGGPRGRPPLAAHGRGTRADRGADRGGGHQRVRALHRGHGLALGGHEHRDPQRRAGLRGPLPPRVLVPGGHQPAGRAHVGRRWGRGGAPRRAAARGAGCGLGVSAREPLQEQHRQQVRVLRRARELHGGPRRALRAHHGGAAAVLRVPPGGLRRRARGPRRGRLPPGLPAEPARGLLRAHGGPGDHDPPPHGQHPGRAPRGRLPLPPAARDHRGRQPLPHGHAAEVRDHVPGAEPGGARPRPGPRARGPRGRAAGHQPRPHPGHHGGPAGRPAAHGGGAAARVPGRLRGAGARARPRGSGRGHRAGARPVGRGAHRPRRGPGPPGRPAGLGRQVRPAQRVPHAGRAGVGRSAPRGHRPPVRGRAPGQGAPPPAGGLREDAHPRVRRADRSGCGHPTRGHPRVLPRHRGGALPGGRGGRGLGHRQRHLPRHPARCADRDARTPGPHP